MRYDLAASANQPRQQSDAIDAAYANQARRTCRVSRDALAITSNQFAAVLALAIACGVVLGIAIAAASLPSTPLVRYAHAIRAGALPCTGGSHYSGALARYPALCRAGTLIPQP